MQELQEAVAKGRCVFIVGTGFSISSSNRAACASWNGLIEQSLEYMKQRNMALEPWFVMIKGMYDYAISAGDTGTLVSVAGLIQEKIRECGDIALSNWLRETVGQLKIQDKTWAEALDAVGCPILTTNYDTLLEQATNRQSASWMDTGEIQNILVSNSTKIGHLHGIWNEPGSVVFSQSDYTRLLSSATAQELQKAVSALKSIVYVGVGAGLSDPNFSRLIEWHRASFSNSSLQHYRLCRQTELGDLFSEHKTDHIAPIAYGDDYSDLPEFLKAISPGANEQVIVSSNGLVLNPVQLAKDALADQVRFQTIVCENSEDREHRSVEELLVPPVLYPISSEKLQAAEHIADHKKVKRCDPHEVSKAEGVTVIVGDENSGLTTTLQWLLNEATLTSAFPPVLVDFKQFHKGGKPLIVQLRTQARTLNLLPNGVNEIVDAIVGIDNATPYAGKLCDQMIADILQLNLRQVFIGCRSENEAELIERLVSAGISPEVRYVGAFGKQDVVRLVSLATPVRPESVAERVMAVLMQQNLPQTPFIVSLLASILLAGNSIAANSSHTTLLDQYLSQLLGRGNVDEDARWSIDSGLREAVLADLAMLYVEQRAGSLPGSVVINRIETYFDKRDISESALELLEYFRSQRVLRTDGSLIRFSHHSYLYLFAAKAAANGAEFREVILEDPTLFAPIIRHYASLKRADVDLLMRMEKYLDQSQHLTDGKAELKHIDLVDAPADLADRLETIVIEDDSGSRTVSPPDSHDHQEDNVIPYSEPEAFPLTVPEDLPAVYRYSIVLDVVSTALRDCDQVPDPALKGKLLRKVLTGWGRFLSLFAADPALNEALRHAIDTMVHALEIGDSERPDFVERALEVFPPIMTMAGISASLSSRKLLKALDKAIDERAFESDPDGAVSAAFMLLDIRETGWASKLDQVTEEHTTLEVIAGFFQQFCSYTYFESTMSPGDEAALLRHISNLSVAGFRFQNDTHRKLSRSRVEQALKQKKAQQRALRASRLREVESADGLLPLADQVEAGGADGESALPLSADIRQQDF